ncbi:hypothetical protein [Pseudomonas sp. Z2-11]
MNHVKAAVFGLLLASHIVYPESTLADAVTPSARGTIILRDIENASCSLTAPEPGKTVVYDFTGDKPCKSDWARTVQFADFPSATVILMTDGNSCSKDTPDQSFWQEIKTIKKNTFSEIIPIEELDIFSPGQIIESGLQLLGKFHDPGEPIRDRLGCVKITTSAAPPAQP